MYPIPSTEKLVETKICRLCQASFPITDKDLEFYDKVSPTFGGKKYSIPSPTLCPDCRQQRRLSFRNERKLYKRKCDATGEDIVSIYSPDKPQRVYHQDYWWSDAWDPMDYGRDFDFGRGFFEQFGELQSSIPQQAIGGVANSNSEYTNYLMNSSDCYLTVSGRNNTKCLYSRNIRDCGVCVDSLQIAECEDVYNLVVAARCHNVLHSFNVFDCRDSEYLFYSRGCTNCFGSINLINKSYYFFNEPYSKDDYIKRVDAFQRLPDDTKKELIHGHILKFPYRCLNAFDNQDFFWIDYVRNSQYIKQSLFLAECENASFCFEQEKSSDLYDCTMGGNENHLCHEGLAIGIGSHNDHFFFYASANSDSFYFHSCFSSSHLFWCIGLRNKSYCILNKQYTKEQYEELVPRIIEHMMKTGEWWEFFPSNLSPFGYNETVAQEYYPMTRDQIIPLEKGGRSGATGGLVAGVNYWDKDGLNWSNPPNPLSQGGVSTFSHWPIFNWSDYEPPFPKVEKIIPASKLPQDITQIPDDILNWAIECEVTKKPFRIIKQELEFYRKHSLPIPKRHPDQRHLDRMAQRNPRKLFERKCDCCHKDMITTYAPERPERVYCEECYNRGVIW